MARARVPNTVLGRQTLASVAAAGSSHPVVAIPAPPVVPRVVRPVEWK